MSDRVRLTVVTGFLGAGKSTWLRHHLRSGVFAGACVVVNEAAATPVDDQLLEGAAQLVTLAGGCACCERRDDLVALLRRLSAPAGGAPPPGRIVLETSGLADPGPIVAAVRADPHLAATLDVSEVVTLVGAPGGLDILRGEPLARHQVRGADCLLVTKLDGTDTATAARLAASLAVLNPAAPIYGAVRGVEVLVPTAPAGTVAALPDGDGADGPPLHAVSVSVAGTDWSRFGLWLSALLHARGSDILRVKGVVATPRGRLLLQGVGGVMEAPVLLPGPRLPGDDVLVVIGRGYAPVDLQRSLGGFVTACGG